MAHLRIVLVEPQSAGNVGAAARVMKNFGFHELWIVGEHPSLEPQAGWWASGADDVLARAHFGRSEILRMRSDRAGSMSCLTRAIQLDPQNFVYHLYRGTRRGELPRLMGL